jgi:hypothetical protein
MREELLAHVLGIFGEESAKLRDDRAALEQTALRFGNPAEVTSQLQETVPAGDDIGRFLEGRFGESTWRTALRFAWVSGALCLALAVFFFVVAFFSAGWVSAWPWEAFVLLFQPVLALPVYLSGLFFLTDWMERSLYGPTGRSWIKAALVATGWLLFMLLWFASVALLFWPAEWDYRFVILILGLVVVPPWFPYLLAHSSTRRKRQDEEWVCLDIA